MVASEAIGTRWKHQPATGSDPKNEPLLLNTRAAPSPANGFQKLGVKPPLLLGSPQRNRCYRKTPGAPIGSRFGNQTIGPWIIDGYDV
jgi:hypothetical protein